MLLRELFEQSSKVAVLAFGRMNPPTIGHAKLVDKIKSIPGDHFLFLSHSQDKKKDPLDFGTKLKFAKAFFPGIEIGREGINTPVVALEYIQSLGYTDVVFVAGSDRVDGFQKLFDTYNGKPDKSGKVPFQFDSITVVSAGERDPDADGAEGMSASKMRAAAATGDFDSFTQGVPNPKLAQQMYDAVRSAMGISQSVSENQSLDLKKNDLMSAVEKFLPIAVKVLDLNKLPEIKLEPYLDHQDYPSFGRFVNDDRAIYLGIKDRHPIDILRTFAHELVHFKQSLDGDLNQDSGKTGSSEENQAHTKAGIIMRMFNKKYPEFFKSADVDINENVADSKNHLLQLERDKRANMLILHILDKNTGKRTEVRGKMGYETNGYDPNDKLHQLLDKVGKSASVSDLMNGDVVSINPRHPDGASAKAAADKAYNENFADGKIKGKSRPGRVKRAGASCSGSVTALRKRAKNSGGERGKMYHWCANMKSGRAKKK